MVSKAQLEEWGAAAPRDLFAWAQFVAQTETLWQDDALVSDADAWQSLWFELEIVNGLALAEWEDQGRPGDWSACWQENYQPDATALAAELLALLRN